MKWICCGVVCLLVQLSCQTVALKEEDNGKDRPPDIVIILTDQQQASAMGCAGTSGLETPAMDSLARNGMRFTGAYTATPQCSPARAAILTGRYPHRTGVMGNVNRRQPPSAGTSLSLDPSLPNLATVFAAAGYQTVYSGKWHLGRDPSQYGFHIVADTNRRQSQKGVRRRHRDELAAAGAVNVLLEESANPLFLMVSFFNPHDIHKEAPRKSEGRGSEQLHQIALPESLADDLSSKPEPQRRFLHEDRGRISLGYTPGDWRLYRHRYHRLVEKVDGEISKVLSALNQRDRRHVVVFASDHGDLAGAHGLPLKGPAMYEELVRVPLIISAPGSIENGVSDALVSTMDILPTLCDLAGIPIPDGIDGLSLASLLTEASPAKALEELGKRRKGLVVEYYGKRKWRVPIRMVRTADWKYVRYQLYGEELYNLKSDPHETRNLAADAQFAETLERLSQMLEDHVRQTKDPFPTLVPTDPHGN
jgi:arylsulfatase A-like enzyme